MTQFLSLIGWAFLPGLVTSWVQTIYYGITIRAGDPKPRPGTTRFAAHRRVIQILVVALYLLYTIYEADHDLRKDSHFYADLGLPFDASDKEIKSRFRRLAAVHHPDKSSGNGAESANVFMHLKLGSDVLQDAAKRFAYERFGPDVVSWQKNITIMDFVKRGVLSVILPHYAVAAATIYILGLFGYMDFGKFYRWLIVLALCVFEIHAVTRPRHGAFLDALNAVLTTVSTHPPYLPFQIITLARKLTITIYIALSQIGPLLKAHLDPESQETEETEEKSLLKGLERLELATKAVDMDAGRLIEMELTPYMGEPAMIANLQGKMKEWLVQNTIRGDPMVRDALGKSLKRRRQDAPPGAKR